MHAKKLNKKILKIENYRNNSWEFFTFDKYLENWNLYLYNQDESIFQEKYNLNDLFYSNFKSIQVPFGKIVNFFIYLIYKIRFNI